MIFIAVLRNKIILFLFKLVSLLCDQNIKYMYLKNIIILALNANYIYKN